MVLLSAAFGILFIVLVSIVVKIKGDRKRKRDAEFIENTKSVVQPVEESHGPERFVKHIEQVLPKNKGLIYEVTPRVYKYTEREVERIRSGRGYHYNGPREGDFVVDLKIIDPISGETLKTLLLEESNRSFDGSYSDDHRIASALESIFRKKEIERLVGETKVIS